ncbi:esterase [Paenibacillus baekrokdamisoli]|uniref:Esterase n=1 Tax=Paenibacillus baekrokdamisoli TaxID=1712516 RepID=A0A3G9IZY0_9BACL|nr:alpha/beta hydrolase [Paenibacillus baekrokdamisoli]MBB3071951.1 acetyl esterase/lipase [Paenibacillus baekrokdamisoli]BBH24066.1 esterase [Paenibacillus baekrokdamisoli]
MDFESRVLPELRSTLAVLPQLNLPYDLENFRNFPIPECEKSPDVAIKNLMIAGPASELLIKIYEPANRMDKNLPSLLWIHGGGYVLGHPDSDDALCERFVVEANCVVVSVDYRLAPEHPYPAAIEDCYAALKWMADSAVELNIDITRIAIAGASAGGGLTAALSLMARDKGGPAISFQMPLYPMIDDRNLSVSSHEITTNNSVWNRTNNVAAWSLYLGELSGGDISQYAAPSRAESYLGLPPTYTCVGQLDPFRDETIEYVSRLAEAGIDVEFHLYPGCFHAFELAVPKAEVSLRASKGYVDALNRALNHQVK